MVVSLTGRLRCSTCVTKRRSSSAAVPCHCPDASDPGRGSMEWPCFDQWRHANSSAWISTDASLPRWSWYFRKKCLIFCITYRRSAPNPIVDSIECHELGLIKTAEQRTIIQHGDWYTGRWLVGCYLAPPSPLLAVPNVTTHSSTTSIPTSYDSM